MHESRNHIVVAIAGEIEARFRGECTGHDWWHVERVRRMALKLAAKEGGDCFVIELAALLHDVGDWKFNGGDEVAGPREVMEILSRHGVVGSIAEHVTSIVGHLGFKGGNRSPMETIEGKIVQDADRLDAIGAIGAARAFAYGGHKGRVLHDPHVPPMLNMSKDEYRKNAGPTTNHFHEKLFLLSDLMNTATARVIAKRRHDYLAGFLKEFLDEWEAVA